MTSLEAKLVQTRRSGMNVSEYMQSSFEGTGTHHQQVTEGHGIEYLLFGSADSETDV